MSKPYIYKTMMRLVVVYRQHRKYIDLYPKPFRGNNNIINLNTSYEKNVQLYSNKYYYYYYYYIHKHTTSMLTYYPPPTQSLDRPTVSVADLKNWMNKQMNRRPPSPPPPPPPAPAIVAPAPVVAAAPEPSEPVLKMRSPGNGWRCSNGRIELVTPNIITRCYIIYR